MPLRDVSPPVDFHDPDQAEAWVRETTAIKPWRKQFFAAFVAAIKALGDEPLAVLELGSGPGLLAEAILDQCAIADYAALDFSAAMHHIARERIGRFGQVRFLERDFKQPDWHRDLGPFDVVVTQQAVHELRQWQHAPALYWQVHDVLWDGGLFLVADHYADGPSREDPALYMTRADQRRLLESSGFEHVSELLDAGEMTLLAARKWE